VAGVVQTVPSLALLVLMVPLLGGRTGFWPAFVALIATSFLSPRQIRRLALAVFTVSLILVVGTLWYGAEVKGARRWLTLLGVNLQPSEFVKPTFAVVSAWLFAQSRLQEGFPGQWIATGLYLMVVVLLIKQPDLGMTAIVSAVWLTQFFLAGLRLIWVALGLAGGAGGLVGAYFALPHVASRIDRFLDPASGDSYQVDRSLEAFANGGLWGRGPGEGTVKQYLPDAHADFVFAVAGEELGLHSRCIRRVVPYKGVQHRYLHVWSKVMETPDGFPRRPGMALKRPLGSSSRRK